MVGGELRERLIYIVSAVANPTMENSMQLRLPKALADSPDQEIDAVGSPATHSLSEVRENGRMFNKAL